MLKRVFIITIVSLAALLTITVSLGMAQQGTTGRTSEVNAPEEVETKSSYIPVQGRLTDASGNPLDGTFVMDFNIYDVYSGGTPLCSDPDISVEAVNGFFSSYMFMGGCRAFDGRQLLLGITVNNDPEMTPRQYIDNVPYAYSLRPGAVISSTMSDNAILHIENWGETGRGLRAYSMSQTGVNYGVVGGSRSPDGFGGYFYNTSAGVGLKASSAEDIGIVATSVNGDGISTSSENGIGIIASSQNSTGLWATSINGTGVHGASGMGKGVEGYSLLGPGVYGGSLNGVAIAANGVITSSAPTYLWISGNDVLPFFRTDSTLIERNSHGGAKIQRGITAGYKSVVLPITIAGTLYGQDVRLTELNIYWQGETASEGIRTIRLRRQVGICDTTCYEEILGVTPPPPYYTCAAGANEKGCTIHEHLTTENTLSPTSGILYLTLELSFSSDTTWIDFGGARLTLEYDQ